MDLGVRGKSLLIVGGTAGMGYATAQVLADEGANLTVVGRDMDKTERKAAALRERGANVLALLADGGRRGEIERVVEQAAAHYGALHGLAVTAGPTGGRKSGPLDFDEADWERAFQVILMMGVRACNAAVPHLRKAGGGAIVLTAAYSIRGLAPYLMPYVAMKSAVASLAKNLAISLGPDNIRVNCVCPGAIATEALDPAKAEAVRLYGGSEEEALGRMMREQWKMDVALGRAGRPNELGELYAFLLSDKAGYLTGAIINEDGGTKF